MSTQENPSQNIPLSECARFYRDELGWSVIPLGPDSKKPVVSWKPYQSEKPSDLRLIQWFEVLGYTGIGIVTGAVSNLAVIDFDIPAHYDTFREQFPVLARTRTVKTAKGYHVYFKLPRRVILKTRQVPGIDLQVDGRYVVAPPTTINGHTYTITELVPPLMLTLDAQSRVMAFLDAYMDVETSLPDKALESASEGLPVDPGEDLTVEAVLGNYHRSAQDGRNNALFHTALLCRDSGWSRQRAFDILVRAHIDAPPPEGHRRETFERRYSEAERTIASAYSRPPQQRTSTERESVSYLPNTLRERLLALKMTPVLRVLEALNLHEVKPNTPISYTGLKKLLSGVVGDWSIRRALGARLPDGGPIFPPRTPLGASAAASGTATLTNNALLSGVQNQQKAPHNRPRQYLVVPSPDELLARLGLKSTGADPVKLNDVRGVKSYRGQLHRTLIERRPGQYSRAWQGKRLNVSVWTLRRYDVAQKIKVLPMKHYTQLYWHNLTALVPQKLDELPGGHWLEIHQGLKKYPLNYGIAQKLLARGEIVYYAYQEPNFYTLGTSPRPAVPVEYIPRHEHTGPNKSAIAAYWESLRQLPAASKGESAPAPPTEPEIATYVRYTLPSKPQPRRKRQTEECVSGLETNRLIERVYTWVNERAVDKAKKISRATLRGLIETYGLATVHEGFRVLKQRENIDAPAGWLVVFCRSSGKRRA